MNERKCMNELKSASNQVIDYSQNCLENLGKENLKGIENNNLNLKKKIQEVTTKKISEMNHGAGTQFEKTTKLYEQIQYFQILARNTCNLLLIEQSEEKGSIPHFINSTLSFKKTHDTFLLQLTPFRRISYLYRRI